MVTRCDLVRLTFAAAGVALTGSSSRGPVAPDRRRRPPAVNLRADEGMSYGDLPWVNGDDEQVIRETFTDVEVEREDGWVVLF
jgi:hypothetical protein